MKLRESPAAGQRAFASGAHRAPARVEPCHWSEERHNYVWVSLQERRATIQVMLGMSLRARWDATLVNVIAGMCALILYIQDTI